jgi:hypothetical protein
MIKLGTTIATKAMRLSEESSKADTVKLGITALIPNLIAKAIRMDDPKSFAIKKRLSRRNLSDGIRDITLKSRMTFRDSVTS